MMKSAVNPDVFIRRNKPLGSHKLKVFCFSRKNALPVIRKNGRSYYESLDANSRDYINGFWKKFAAENPCAFNGSQAKLESLRPDGAEVSYTDYKAFAATSKFDFYGHNTAAVACPLTVTPVIITKDRKIVYGYRKNTLNLQFPGGMIDYFKDGYGAELSAVKCARREISEELGPFETYDYKYLGASVSLKDIFATLYVYCRTDNSFGTILQTRNSLKESISDFYELPEIFAADLNPASLSGLLDQNSTGTMSTAVMLLGRRLYGSRWYKENLKKLYGKVYIDFDC